MTKKVRSVWIEDSDWKKLVEKAKARYNGRGYMERFLEEIARKPIAIVDKEKNIKLIEI